MTRWQYTRDEAYSREILDTLNRYGKDGWECFSVVTWTSGTSGATLYFKRPTQERSEGE